MFLLFSEILVKHVYKNLFIPIIQYSDVGIDPEAEEEMEQIQPFGRQAIEEEIEDETEENEIALQVGFFFDEKLIEKNEFFPFAVWSQIVGGEIDQFGQSWKL